MLTDPLWEDYRELAKLSGLRACWSTPIFTGSGKVLGSFAMYYRTPQAPTGSEARLTEVATHIAGIAIEHERAQQDHDATETTFALVIRGHHVGIRSPAGVSANRKRRQSSGRGRYLELS